MHPRALAYNGLPDFRVTVELCVFHATMVESIVAVWIGIPEEEEEDEAMALCVDYCNSALDLCIPNLMRCHCGFGSCIFYTDTISESGLGCVYHTFGIVAIQVTAHSFIIKHL